jgi:Integrase zinc binding domain
VQIYSHSGVMDENYSSTLKLLLQNNDDSEVRMTAGTFIVEAIILPTIHPTLNFENGVPCYPKDNKESKDEVQAMSVQVDENSQTEKFENESEEDELDSSQLSSEFGSQGRASKIKNFRLTRLPTSYLHMMMDESFPGHLTVPEMNTVILLPEDECSRKSIIDDVAQMESQMMPNDGEINVSLIYHPCPNPEAVIQDFTQEMRELSVQTQTDPPGEDPSLLEKAKDSAHSSMCEKLAVISVDLLKNKSMTRTMLAQTQQGDDYLGVIRDMVAKKDPSLSTKNFFIQDQVLYKKCMSSGIERHVICLPDVLLPAVIHFLHVNLGHSSCTVTKRNFEHYYYSRNATRMIRSYTQACVTCALSHKFDIHKGTPETKRSLEPTRPRQYIYCDLIPMQTAGGMSYILFCLDAYSQFVSAVPLRDKRADSVIQGFISLFASSTWPEAIYMDNETSFRSAGKQLVRMAPVKILYSVPYCQFQNWSENYIKNFKKSLIKLLTDAEHSTDEWHLMLPTVTGSLNRQVIPGTGLTRESIHFNMVTPFHPLAHLTSSSENELNREVNALAHNWFQKIVEKRKRLRIGSKKSQIPEFHETQIVFMRDNAPSISTILKYPNKGPYRIIKINGRNVELEYLPTGKTVHSHVQYIRPLDLSEYRLLLSKGWDLNGHDPKAGLPVTHPGIFDTPSHPVHPRIVEETERRVDSVLESGDLENLFHSQPADEIELSPIDAPQEQNLMPKASRPLDIDQLGPSKQLRRSPRFSQGENDLMSTETELNSSEIENVSQENDLGEQTFSCLALHPEMDLSKLYQEKLAAAKSENADPFSLGDPEEEFFCPKPVLKPKKSISFGIPAPIVLLFPEKSENDFLS